MTAFILAVFVATYAGMALGRVPGLRVDRTGIALMAVALLLAAGVMSVEDIARAGVPMTLSSIVVAATWLALGGWTWH